MGIKKLFGLGKKEPFRVPLEASRLRIRIASENKENFPHRERYREIARDTEAVYRVLDGIIAQKVYAEEAIKLQEDIKKKLAALADRIRNNINEGKKESSPDYVEKNIDYLERKSMRNSAKDLFTDFLRAHDQLLTYCREGRSGQGEAIDSAASAMIAALSEMRDRYFRNHGQDREIQDLIKITQEKMSVLGDAYEKNKASLEAEGLKARMETNVTRLRDAVKG
jgi:hypothetical protein